MAKHGRRKPYRKFNSKFQVLPVNDSSALTTLADATVLRSGLTAIDDDFWVQSADLSWAISGLAAGQGPLLFGIAHGDLSVTEIAEAVNASPTGRGDIIEREQARRPVRRVGQLLADPDGGNLSLNDGKPIRTTVKMYLEGGIELNMFTLNQSGVALTTGAVVRVYGVLYGSWQ